LIKSTPKGLGNKTRRVRRRQMKHIKPSDDKKIPGTTTPTIPQMFDACMARENWLLSPSHKENVLALYKRILFGQPLFWPDPIAGYSLFEEVFDPLRDPYTFSVARREDETSSVGEGRYLKLLELLRGEKDAELRWLLLARWLKQESICEPEKFLPKPILDRIVRRYFKAKEVSVSDLFYWALITGWKIYFARLLSDLQRVQSEQGDPQAALVSMGYDATAIRSVIVRKSIASAIMHWISERRHLQVETLQNAYSKTRGDNRKRPASAL
jgi:hypothetical protein